MQSSEYFSSSPNCSSALTHAAKTFVVRWGWPKHFRHNLEEMKINSLGFFRKYLSYRTPASHERWTFLWTGDPQLGSLSFHVALSDFQSPLYLPQMFSPIHIELFVRHRPDQRCGIAKLCDDEKILFSTSSVTSAVIRPRLGKKLSPDAIASCIQE